MYRTFYEGLTFAWLPTATTVFFLTVFVVMLLRVFVFRSRRDFEPIAALPLAEEEKQS